MACYCNKIHRGSTCVVETILLPESMVKQYYTHHLSAVSISLIYEVFNMKKHQIKPDKSKNLINTCREQVKTILKMMNQY